MGDSQQKDTDGTSKSPEERKIINPFVIPGIEKLKIDPQLKPNNTFENFIEGDCNRLLRSAGYAIAKNPGGTAFNPLMIYSDSGLGKTHLVQAIGHETKKRYPDKHVLYVDADKFRTQFIEAARKDDVSGFLNFYQAIDMLIVDDVQGFANKEETQKIFFHIFNHLHQMGKQLILTSDKAPVELKGLNQNLLSRFRWGLTSDLQKPDFETKMSILKDKMKKDDGVSISEDILEHIALKVNTNIRELEGALTSILAQAILDKKEITMELATKVISKLISNKTPEIKIDYISRVVTDYFDMPVASLQLKTRKREIVQARQIAMYFSKKLTKESLAKIGAAIGSKDHATVLHACKTVNNLKDTDKNFREFIEDIEKKLR